MFPSMKTRFPIPDDEIQPRHFTLPPPYLMVGALHLESNASFDVRQTITFPADLNKLNLLSLVNSTWSRSTEAALDIFLHTGYV